MDRRSDHATDIEVTHGDGRIRRWTYIPEVARFLRVVLLSDGATVHNALVEETREISENVYIFDKAGNLVSMTIEHAATVARFPQVRIGEIDVSAA